MSYEPALNNVKAICIQICLVDKKEDKVQYASIQRQLFHIVIYVCPPGGRGPLLLYTSVSQNFGEKHTLLLLAK
jgi:hypothetical protein